MAALGVVDHNARAVILRMDGVPALDSTGLVALESALDLLRAHRCMAVITGLRPQPEGALRKAEVEARHKVRLCRDLPEALALIERVKGGTLI
jgi:MFS superfamily sulfate permease-like transporter